MDTWQPLISLLEPSKFKDIWKFKISHEIWTFRIRYSHFARSCKILRWVVAACWNTFWTISHESVKFSHESAKFSHESAKFSHDHAKSTYTSSLTWNQFSLSSSFRTIMRICNIWFLSFPLPFIPFHSFDSTLITYENLAMSKPFFILGYNLVYYYFSPIWSMKN